jgi:hypothetical protein
MDDESPAKRLAKAETVTFCVYGEDFEKVNILGETSKALGLNEDVETGSMLIVTLITSPARAAKRTDDSRR